MDDETERSPMFIQSLEKAMRVLECFSSGGQFLGLGQIASLTGLSKPSAQRSTHTLVELGYLAKSESDGRYSLGLKCLDLTYSLLRPHPLISAAYPVLLQLRDHTGERTNLSFFDRTTIVYAIRLQGAKEFVYTSSLIGRRVPAFSASGGRAMLAALPDAEVESIIAESDLRQLTPETVIDPEKIKREVEVARSRGYAVSVSQTVVGEITIGAAILDERGRPVAAIHLASNVARWSRQDYEDRFAPLVVQTAHSLSHFSPTRRKTY